MTTTYDLSMRLIRSVLVALCFCALVGSPVATAKQYAPPGKAGTSEYGEDIPTGGGNVETPAMGGGNTTRTDIDKLGAGKTGVRKLAKLGKSGAAAALLAQQIAPATETTPATKTTTGTETTPRTSSGRVTGTSESGGPDHQSTPLTAPGRSAIGGLWSTITGSDVDGIGVLLPLLLAFGLGAAVATIVMRSRRDEPPHA
jgi:hypothetical protein